MKITKNLKNLICFLIIILDRVCSSNPIYLVATDEAKIRGKKSLVTLSEAGSRSSREGTQDYCEVQRTIEESEFFLFSADFLFTSSLVVYMQNKIYFLWICLEENAENFGKILKGNPNDEQWKSILFWKNACSWLDDILGRDKNYLRAQWINRTEEKLMWRKFFLFLKFQKAQIFFQQKQR